MEVDHPGRLPAPAASAATASRKRMGQASDSDSEDTHAYYLSSEDFSDDGFQPVLSRKAKRRNMRTSSSSTIQTVSEAPKSNTYTILFLPALPTVSMKRLNRQSVSRSLETLVPNEITDIRVNARKNILAVDVLHASALGVLRSVTDLDGNQVRSHVPLGCDVVTGVIYDIDVAISNKDLQLLVKSTTDTPIVDVTRLGKSRCVKIAFKSTSLPSHVKVGYFRHAVRPFIPKPLQCRKCMKLGHVSSVCENSVVCHRCAEHHEADKCVATVKKCSNCNGSHEATSKDCPRIQKEIAILKEMVRDHSSHREAAAKVRRRRSRRRRSSRTPATSSTRLRDPSSVPPPLPPRPHAVGKAVKDKASEHTLTATEWPALQREAASSEPKELHDGQSALPVRDLSNQDRQVTAIVQSLIATIRTLLSSIQSPSAKSALQILDALNPVLANFV